ncbi:MAG: hypothetical protein JSR19_05815 [Proteobacteria bacterium]|nr:hypothetical protein [Pseudomonadota bacterium]HQR04692.1 cell division protein ZipA C-terminal FtsZ-binding domain-containing protein [Rhodocyclaceae bacterium]
MMPSDFQLTLIGAGAALVALVWGYNLWQERKHRKAAERIFRGSQPDVLLPAEAPASDEMEEGVIGLVRRREGSADPLSGERLEPRLEPVSTDTDRIEPSLAPEPVPDSAMTATPAALTTPATPQSNQPADADTHVPAPENPPQTPPQITAPASETVPEESLADPVIELALPIDPGSQQSAARLWAVLHPLTERVSKRLRLIGRRDGRWQEIALRENGAFDGFRALLQLADRRGAVTESELAQFADGVFAITQELGGKGAHPNLPNTMAHARALDDFCASIDIQISVHVVSRSGGGIAGSKLRGLLEAGGFELRHDGMFYLMDERGQTLVSLSNFGAAPFVAEEMKNLVTTGVTFWLDVPKVENGPGVFDRLVTAAQRLADAIDGMLVDDRRQPLAANVLASIRAKIGEIQQTMSSNELPAGGRRAQRLFS